MRIAVFGLGKLGSVLAAVFASSGHEVVGIDLNEVFVDTINAGIAPVEEPGLQQLVDQAAGRLSATTDAAVALQGAGASYVIVPTPSEPDGGFTNRYLIAAIRTIGSSLSRHSEPHTIVICSTVMPGSCDGELRSALETSSGRTVGQNVGLVYSPEFIALGSVVHDMRNPDLVLIGESDAAAGDLVEQNARSVVHNSPVVRRMSLVNAEIVKISINTFVTTKISFANMLAEICDQLPGADVDVVTMAVGSDSRIGTKYLKGALGYGGPCFPRDNLALTRLGESLGVDASIARATDEVNSRQVQRTTRIILDRVARPARVAVLGLAYKPSTPVCECSQGVDIANSLAGLGYDVVAADPQAASTARAILDPRIHVAESPEEAVMSAQAVIVSTAWPDFTALDLRLWQGRLVIDSWGLLPPEAEAVRPGRLRAGQGGTS